MKNKPLILISPRKSTATGYPDENTYMDSSVSWNQLLISEHGGIPVMIPMLDDDSIRQMVELCDGVFLTGGADINPRIYGEEKAEYCGEIQNDRDSAELSMIKYAMEMKKPMLCICRGFQIFNAAMGGTLYQDIPTQTGTSIKHSNWNVKEFYGYEPDTCAHPVNIVPDTPLAKLVGENTIYTNSLHHQGIKQAAPGVIIQAYAPDGIPESFYVDTPDQYIRGYQWHPEFQTENSVKAAIVNEFLDECSK